MIDNDQNKKKLPIKPMEIPGKIKKVPISKLKSGIIPEKSFKIDNAVVAFVDVLGFSNKKDSKDVEMTLFDFSAPLALSSRQYPKVRFNVFSDCAFVATSIENAADLLSAIRFAFRQWISDGILIRGGIAKGSYNVTSTFAQEIASENYIGNLFSGSAVTEAVKLEGSGEGALLFVNDDCAEFYEKKYGEPIFILEKQKIIGWTDDESIIYWFTGISFLRLLKFLSLKNGESNSVAKKLLNNLRYSATTSDQSRLLSWFLILAILSSPTITKSSREKAINLLKIKDPEDFIPYNKLIREWLNHKDKFRMLKAFADSDSGLP
jgi:hypothetical protein